MNRRSSGSTAPQATVAFRHGVVIQGTAYGCGSDARTLYCRVIHPTSQRIALFLKPVQIGFHLCDTAGDFFGTTAEVHPAEFIQLRLQMVYFASRLLSFSCRAWISASCSARRCFSRKMSSEEMSFISPYFTGLIL